MSDNKILKGNAGEYFVAGELSRRGFIVAVPMSNVPNFDILAINQDQKEFAIQVKSTSTGIREWILNAKNEEIIGDNVFYIFVAWKDLDNNIEYHIVPSSVVAKTIKKDNDKWLQTPGKNNQAHNENGIRIFNDNYNKYLNNWEILK